MSTPTTTTSPPPLETGRLLLRRLELPDAGRVRELAGEREVAATTVNIPHPYPEDAAESWIAQCHRGSERGDAFTFALTLRPDGELIGAAGLHLDLAHSHAERGYWIGRPYWGRGYATEAARRVVRFGFEELELNRIFAWCFTGNVASARVMERRGCGTRAPSGSTSSSRASSRT